MSIQLPSGSPMEDLPGMGHMIHGLRLLVWCMGKLIEGT
jgi:hypothetical protein